jgi:hypothetical protein
MKILLSLVFALVSTANAFSYSSENVRPVLRQYKLEKNWRPICHHAIDDRNEEIDFVEQKDGVVMAYRTALFVPLFFILDAEPHGKRYVKLRVRAGNVTTPGMGTMILEVGEDSLRVYSNISDSGQKFIEDGILVESRQPTPYFSRC